MVTIADLESSQRNLEQSMTHSITNVITEILSRQPQQHVPRTEQQITGSMINNNTGSGAVNHFNAPPTNALEVRGSSKHGWRNWLKNSTSTAKNFL